MVAGWQSEGSAVVMNDEMVYKYIPRREREKCMGGWWMILVSSFAML